MPQGRILIGIPAFRGARFIRETLDAISMQDHRAFRALISVDGGDTETAAACEPYLADPRFSLVMQEQRLGWAGNINWLMSQPDWDYFCYWQQDDLASVDYLSELLKGARTHPSAVCYFCDIQWTGQWSHRLSFPSVTGLRLDRALGIFETLNGVPLRGLIRKAAIDRAGPIRLTEYESAFEEYVWVAKLALVGNLHRVEAPLYFKRAHDASTHRKWHDRDRRWKRAAWLEFGLGMLEAIWPFVAEDERATAVGVILERLCCPKEGRFLLYDGPPVEFASDFLSLASRRVSMPPLEPTPFAGSIAGELMDRAIAWSRRKPGPAPDRPTSFQFCIGGAGIDLLSTGWAWAEAWGTWSNGPVAGLHLPVGSRPGTWIARFTFTTFGAEGSEATVTVQGGAGWQGATWCAPVNHVVVRELRIESAAADVVLQFAFPDATSPKALGQGDDDRQLGMGLRSLELVAAGD